MNTVHKGNRTKNKAKVFLAKAGFLVANVEYRTPYNKIDLFGLFDIISITSRDVCFVQVTTNKAHAHRPLKEFACRFPNIKVMQVVYYDRDMKPALYFYNGMPEAFPLSLSSKVFSVYEKKGKKNLVVQRWF